MIEKWLSIFGLNKKTEEKEQKEDKQFISTEVPDTQTIESVTQNKKSVRPRKRVLTLEGYNFVFRRSRRHIPFRLDVQSSDLSTSILVRYARRIDKHLYRNFMPRLAYVKQNVFYSYVYPYVFKCGLGPTYNAFIDLAKLLLKHVARRYTTRKEEGLYETTVIVLAYNKESETGFLFPIHAFYKTTNVEVERDKAVDIAEYVDDVNKLFKMHMLTVLNDAWKDLREALIVTSLGSILKMIQTGGLNFDAMELYPVVRLKMYGLLRHKQ